MYNVGSIASGMVIIELSDAHDSAERAYDFSLWAVIT
jgi:hypothetical protein